MSFSKYLRDLRKSRNISYRALWEKTWIYFVSISQWETWRVKIPEEKFIHILTKWFWMKKKEVNDIISSIKIEEAVEQMSPKKRKEFFWAKIGADCLIPVYSSIWAWYWRLPNEFEEYMPIPESLSRKKWSLYYSRISWDSMSPSIEEWDLVLIDTSQKEIINSSMVFALQYNHDEATVKKLKLEWNTIFLIPENTTHEIRKISANDDEFRILWRVINVIKSM